ncbi:MAG: carboxymuconolactone decarboxylase family protein [bacterium]|nr:carboxymuconolactone decarboxylase family protein [bacterium]
MFTSVPLPKDDQLPESIKNTLDRLPSLNVFRMLSNVPGSFHSYIDLAKSLLGDGKFDARLREIAVLRQAHLLKSKYEWHQHVFLAKTNGVTDDEITIIKKENPVTSLGDEENFMCLISEELTLNANLSDSTFEQLFTRYSVELGMELILCLSYVNMLGRFINASRVQIEDTNPLDGLASPTN